ncbi:hypothetical protein NOCARDAX2BIS_200035 [Nocardioides sp. AX2bis]|nr:hypothetical protein NOCARDAX2BIS_200035 [Nocardioides sp. AX2bis]
MEVDPSRVGVRCAEVCRPARARRGGRPGGAGAVGVRGQRAPGREHRPRPGRRGRDARARGLSGADPRGRGRREQRHRDGALRPGAHRGDLRDRRDAGRAGHGGLRRPRGQRLRLPDLRHEVRGVPGRRRVPGHAHHRELGLVPPQRGGVGRGRALVPLRRGRRRRREHVVRPPARVRQGPPARPSRRPVDGLRRRRGGGRLPQGALHRAAPVARGDDHQGR